MADSIKLFPNMPKDEATQKVLMKTLEDRDQQDYQCYLILKDVLAEGHLDDIVDEDDNDDDELYIRAQEAISKRIDLNDKFLRMMAGQ